METIVEIRRKLNLSQAEMAERLGVTQSTISRLETGELPTNTRTLMAAQAMVMGRDAA